MTRSPFHPGELEAQALTGGGAPGGGIREFMTDRLREFFESLPFVVVGTAHEGWPALTILAGESAFVAAPDARTLRISAAADGFVPGAPVGILGIDLATLRRNRANGVVRAVSDRQFVIEVRQSFGNCPKYIHPRAIHRVRARERSLEKLQSLDGDAIRAIASADTFFVASASWVDHATGGVDVSHRGGPAGFVHLEGNTLTIPDYSGNRYFNTLGNLVANPRAALLFVDFQRGDLLHVRGTTEIVWDGPEVGCFAGAQRLWRVRVVEAWRRRGALPLRWTAPVSAERAESI